MSRRGFALGVCALLLAACAGLLPRSIVLGEPELQAQLARRFPIERSLFDTFTLKLSDPLLSLDAAAGRLGTELTLQGSDLRNGRSLQGRLALDYGLRWEPADASVRLVQPRVQRLDFAPAQGLSAGRADMAQRMGVALAERLLDDLVLYRVPAQRLEQLRAAGLQPGKLQITPAGVEITLQPLDAAAATKPAQP